MPQVPSTIDAFEKGWLQNLVRRSDKLAVLIPPRCHKGMSTHDIEAALTETRRNLDRNRLSEEKI
jgi:hypothetical protein